MNTMEERQERLLRAIGGVGGDLIATAEQKRFPMRVWQKWLPVAACLVLLVGLTALVLPILRTEPEMEVTMEAAQPVTQPEAETDTVEQEETAAVQVLFRWSDEEVQPKERLIIGGTIYYVEAVYEAEREALGDWVAAVDGWNVYAGGSTWKPDKWGTSMPLEVFAAQEDGYRYCLTYYAWDGPTYTMEEAKALEDLTVLALGVDFADPADLTEEALVSFFLDTLALERQAGRRTVDLDRYLWYDETKDVYVIPAEDVAAQLERYLEGWNWPELAEHEALVLNTLEPAEREEERFAAAVFDEDTLNLTTDKRTYTIRFTADGCLYQRIAPK